MFFTLTVQTAPESAMNSVRYITKTRLPGVIRARIHHYNDTFGFEIDPEEWLSSSATCRSLQLPGGFPFIELELSDENA